MRRFSALKIVIILLATTLFTPAFTAQGAQTEVGTESREQHVIDSLIKQKSSAAIAPFQDTLFYVYGNIGSVSAKSRATIINENIRELSRLATFNSDSLLIEKDANSLNITYSGNTIIGVSQLQARLVEKEQEELTEEYRELIISAISKEKSSKRWYVILRRIVFSILLVVAAWYGIKYLNILYRRLYAWVGRQHNYTIRQLHTLLDANQQIRFAQLFVKGLRLFLVIMILYFCILTFFSLYPGTKWLSTTLIGYIIEPLGTAFTAIKEFIPDLFKIIVIIFLFRVLIKAARVFAEKVEDESITISGFHSDWAMSTFNIVRGLLYIFMFIFIFPYLPGNESPAFQGVSVFLGILFSLGSTSIIGNVVSGLVITYMRPFSVGDRIKMGEYVGDVIEETPLVTRLKTPKNEVITIPNSTVMSAETVNYTKSALNHGLILHTNVAGGYEFDWRLMHQLLLRAADRTENVMKEPKPFVHQTALDDFYAQYQINVYVRDASKMAGIYSELYSNIQDVFGEEGIELVSPHISGIRDATSVYIPPNHMKKGFEFNPPFQLKVKREQMTQAEIDEIVERNRKQE